MNRLNRRYPQIINTLKNPFHIGTHDINTLLSNRKIIISFQAFKLPKITIYLVTIWVICVCLFITCIIISWVQIIELFLLYYMEHFNAKKRYS